MNVKIIIIMIVGMVRRIERVRKSSVHVGIEKDHQNIPSNFQKRGL